MATRKNPAEIPVASGIGATLGSASENSYPLAFVHSLWDVVSTEDKAELANLLGLEKDGNTDVSGYYAQDEINKAVAEKLADIVSNLSKVASAGAYVSNNGSPFASKQALDAVSANQDDYALVAITETVNSTPVVTQLEHYTYDASVTKQIKVNNVWYTRNESGDSDQEHSTYLYCWTNGSTNVYTKVENVKARSGSSAQEDEQVYATSAVDAASAGDIEKVNTNWQLDYALDKSQFTNTQWQLISEGKIGDALDLKLNDLPTNAQLTTLLAGKQDNLTFDSAPTDGSTKPVTSGGVYTAINNVDNKISTSASSSNKVLSESEINDKISSISATFRGTFEAGPSDEASNLPTRNVKAGDYAFVIGVDGSGNPEYNRYVVVGVDEIYSFEYGEAGSENTYVREAGKDETMKAAPGYPLYAYTNTDDNTDTVWLVYSKVDDNGVVTVTTDKGVNSADVDISDSVVYTYKWEFQYTLNNSSFTAGQWNAIQSGITSEVATWAANKRTAELNSAAQDKFSVSSSGGYTQSMANRPTDEVPSTYITNPYNQGLYIQETTGGQTTYREAKSTETTYDNSKTYLAYKLTMTVTIIFNNSNVTPSNAETKFSGWTEDSTGVYKKTIYVGTRNGALVGTTSIGKIEGITYTPPTGDYKGIKVSGDANAQSISASYPRFMGFSTVLGGNSVVLTSSLIKNELETNGIPSGVTTSEYAQTKKYTKTAPLSLEGASSDYPKRLWVIGKMSSVSADHKSASNTTISASDISLTYNGMPLTSYKAFVAKNNYDNSNIDDLTVTVTG